MGKTYTQKNTLPFALTKERSEQIVSYPSRRRFPFDVFVKILKIGNKKSDILKILLNAIETFFGSDPVYKLSFSEEFTTRLGNIDSERHAQEFIGQELIQNLEDKVSFFSKNVFQGRTFEAYLLNAEGTANNLLFKYLKDKDMPPEVSRTFFNTCNNDMAESVWFFVCSEDNLRL